LSQITDALKSRGGRGARGAPAAVLACWSVGALVFAVLPAGSDGRYLVANALYLGAAVFAVFSLVERNIEREVLPVCEEEGLGVIPWSPLGGGFLSGKYRRGEEPPRGSRISEAVESMEEYWDRRATERNWAVLDVVDEISEATGKSYAQISLNWLLRQPAVTAPIIGARTAEQLEDNLGASGWELDEEQVNRLSEAGAPEDTYPYRFIRNAQRI
jgi:aryl-alcohol dehydrogenase-like predicted oxidoreductase